MREDIRIIALFGARVIYGQERANIETLAQLRARGCHVLCVVRDEDWPELISLRRALEQRDLECVKIPYIDYPVRGWLLHAFRRNLRVYRRANRQLVDLARSFRATHIHAFNPLYVAAFRTGLGELPTPLIYRCGDAPVVHNAFYRWTWSFIKKRTIHFVADSRFIEGLLRSTGIENDRISVIYAPAPLRTANAELPPIPGTTVDDVFRFVYAGQLNSAKGVDVMTEAFAQIAKDFTNVHLIVAGALAASDPWLHELRSRIAAGASGGQIHFVGFVEDIPGLLGACDVHLAPSRSPEPYGLVVVEAKQAGRPSIIFASGGMRELVENEVDGFSLETKTPSALASAMRRYLCEHGLAKRHGQKAIESIDRLRIPDFGRRWYEVYACTSVQDNSRPQA
jgi:glycosyltransferase involved in cell wall biosynthesis